MRARLLLLLAAVAAVLGLGAPAASAHDVLISTSPKDGSTVATAPSKVTLTFNNPAIATGSVIQVKGPDGPVDEGKPQFVDHVVTQPLKAGAPAGDYTVTWRVTSVDGHPISGTFRFTATAAAAGASSEPTATPGGATATTQAVTGTSSPTAVPSAAPSSDAASDEPEDGRNLLVTLVGLLVVGAIVGALVGLVRRRSRSDGTTRHTHDEDDED
ncbi:copper resistance CopC family protein [Luteipulveratus halotolerans]|uniref:CopC domain-containing protein n=1 Tax=Luteipulveratus halotolerans TaxID=1631356 RepID=A0A0L6CMS7_9MICO|nr:copper resistance CopC family protein [Luteipulveratus halotolerans]KNX39039.1 hypothetical protein VV01_20945 [Luteipulveratus halotolerans]